MNRERHEQRTCNALKGKEICDRCGKKLKHVKQHEKLCKGKPQLVPDDNWAPNPVDPLVCPEPDCDYTRPKVSAVKSHWKHVHVKKHCHICNKDMAVFFYAVHMLESHNIEPEAGRKITCEDCGEIFASNRSLNHHRDVVHIREPRYICDVCGHACIAQRFLTSHRYESHYRTQRKNPCSVCGVVFRSIKPLKIHMKEVHGMKWTPPA